MEQAQKKPLARARGFFCCGAQMPSIRDRVEADPYLLFRAPILHRHHPIRACRIARLLSLLAAAALLHRRDLKAAEIPDAGRRRASDIVLQASTMRREFADGFR